jgi:cytochrome c553
MRRSLSILGLSLFGVSGLVAWQQPPRKDLDWAFPQIDKDLPLIKDDGRPRRVPGSDKLFTQAQIDDHFNPPDWFPAEHPPWPKSVQFGNRPIAQACSSCHLSNGLGHPESANITGLSAAFMIRQMADFKNGVRKNSEPMIAFAKNLSDQDAREASEYFAALKPSVWYKVIEAATVPRNYVNSAFMRLPRPEGGTEPIGHRIITLPQDTERTESRDPHSGFIAYVPPGSLKKGEALVKTGGSGKTIACDICHGPGLRGLGEVPRIAGQHPIYIVRQLYKFQNGQNGGSWAPLMKGPAAKLTDDDILSIAAYVASLAP